MPESSLSEQMFPEIVLYELLFSRVIPPPKFESQILLVKLLVLLPCSRIPKTPSIRILSEIELSFEYSKIMEKSLLRSVLF